MSGSVHQKYFPLIINYLRVVLEYDVYSTGA